MNLFVLNMAIFYIIHWLKIFKNKFNAIMYMYKLERDLSDYDLVKIIKQDEKSMLSQRISGVSKKGFEGFQKALDEINEHIEIEKKLNSDVRYREERVRQYRNRLKLIYALKGLKMACVTFLSNLWILTPGVILFATGSKYMWLLALLLTLTKYAMKRDDEITEAITYVNGDEYAQSKYIKASIVLNAIYDATITQWYFVTYVILLYFII